MKKGCLKNSDSFNFLDASFDNLSTTSTCFPSSDANGEREMNSSGGKLAFPCEKFHSVEPLHNPVKLGK